MSAVSDSLDLRIKRPLRAIDDTDYPKLHCEAAAVRYAIENSGLQDKTIAIEVETDAGTLSKAKLGQARLNDDSLHRLMDITGIEAPLIAMLLRRGYDPRSVRRFESDIERENRLLREKVARMEVEREIEMRTVRGIISAHAVAA